MRKSSVSLVERTYRAYIVRGQKVYLILERAIDRWVFSRKVEMQGQIYNVSELGLSVQEYETLLNVARREEATLNL